MKPKIKKDDKPGPKERARAMRLKQQAVKASAERDKGRK